MSSQDTKTESLQSAKTYSLKKTLTIATAIMVGSVFLSRVIGLIREQVLAVYGGTHFEIDAYVTAFFIPELLNHFLAGGFLSVTFIPIYQGYLFRKDHQGGSACFSNLITIGSLFFILLIPLSIYFTPEILGLMGSHITDPARKAVTIRLTRIILPAQIFFYWGAFLCAVQMAHQRFFLPALAPLVYNLGIILGGILLGPTIGIEGFAWGVLAGAFAGNFLMQLPGAIKLGIKFSPRFDLTDPDFIKYIRLTLPLVLGLGLTFSNEVFFRYFGSFLGEGDTASINYALRTMMMVVAVFGQASGVAFFPFISQLAIEKQFEKMTVLLNSVLTKIVLYLLPLSAIMIVLSREIIGVLFQHGKFDAASTLSTAPVLSVYLLGAFGFSAVMIINRSFYAMQNTVLPMIVSTLIAILSLPVYWFFSKETGAVGIALSAVLCMTFQFLVLYIMWLRKYFERASTLNFARIFLKALVITVIGAVSCWLIKATALPFTPKVGTMIGNMIVLGVASLPSLALVFFLYEVYGIQNFRESVKALIRR